MADFDPFQDGGAVAVEEPPFDPFKAGAVPVEEFDPFKAGGLPIEDTPPASKATPVSPSEQPFYEGLLQDAVKGVNQPAPGTIDPADLISANSGKRQDEAANLTPLSELGAGTRGKVEKARANDFRIPSITEAAMTPQEIIPKLTKEQIGRVPAIIENIAADTGNFFTSPLGVASMGIGALPKLAQGAISLGFALDAASKVPEKVGAIVDAKTPEELDKAIVDAGETALVLAGTGAHLAGRPGLGGLKPGETRPPSMSETEANRAATQNQLRALAPDVVPEPKVAQPATPETIDSLVLSRNKLSDGFENQPKEVQAQRQQSIDDIDSQLLQMDKGEVAASESRIKSRDQAQSEQAPPTESVPASPPEEVAPVEPAKQEAKIDDETAKTYSDSAERIADQVANGQPTEVREAARDAALDNAMSSLKSGKNPSVSFMRKSAQEAAGKAAGKQGEPLVTPEGETRDVPAPEPAPENKELLGAMDQAIGGLPEREGRIIRGVQEGRTLDDIASEHGISKQRVSQIVQENLPVLRKALEDRGFTKDDYAGGPGAMGPVEALEMKMREADSTGLKREVVDTERLSRGADPIPTAERQREDGVVRDAEDKAATDPTATPELVSRIVDEGDTAISEHDAALLLVERARLMNERKAWEERLADGEQKEVARTRLQQIEDETSRLDQAQRAAGTTWGRLGHMYQRMIRDDYTLEAMERKMRAVVDRPLTETERATLKTESERIDTLQKEVDARKSEVETAALNQEVNRTIEATINELGKSYLAKPAYGKQVFDIARTVVDRWKSEAAGLEESIQKRLGGESGGVGGVGGGPGGKKLGEASNAQGSLIGDIAKVIRARVGEFGLSKAEVFAEMGKKFGDKVKPHLNAAWQKFQDLVRSEKVSQKTKDVLKTGVKKSGEPTVIDSLAKAKAESVAGEELSHQTAFEYVRSLINEKGIHGADELMKAAHEGLNQYYPDLTERDVRRVYSEYGKVKFPSKDATKMELAEVRRITQLQESIDRLKEGKDALHTGLQRDKATQAIREKQKELNSLLKNRKGPPSPEALTSRDEAKQTALRNQIEDLDKQLRTGEKPVQGEPAPDNTKTEQLKAERDAMKAKLAEIEKEANPGKTPDQIANENAIKATQKSIDEIDRRLRDGELEAKKQPEKPVSKELEQLRSQRDAMRDKLRDLQNEARPKTSAVDKQIEQLSKVRDRLDETLSGKRPENAPKDWTPLSAAAADIKAEIQAMQELADQMKRDAKPPTDPNAAKERAQIRALEDSIRRYEDKTAKADFSSAGKINGPDTQKVTELREIRDARKEAYDAAKKASQPIRTPEERYNETRMKAIEKRIAELQYKISKGDFTRPSKRVPPEKTKEVLDAEFLLSKVKQKFNNRVFQEQLKNRSAIRKVLEGTRDVLNTARAVKTAFDLSAVLRQGGFITLSHPIRAAKAFPAMFKALRSERGQFEVNKEIQERPNAPLYKSSKLHLNDPGDPHLSKMEEAYMSRWSSKIPGVAHSERAYTTFLNRLRADSFDAMVKNIGENATPEELKAISNFVNVATGRGNLAGAQGAAISLNTAFFAPRYVISRFEMLAGQPLWKGSARTRIEISKEYAKYLGAIAVIYGLAKSAGAGVETDSKSADFGKLKFGNTRVDLLSGFAQSAVVLSRMAQGKTKDSKEVTKPADAAEVTGRFVRGKLAPTPGTILDLLSGKNVVGEKVTAKDALINTFAPLSVKDIYDAMIDHGIPEATALSLLSIFGASIQTYKSKPSSGKSQY